MRAAAGAALMFGGPLAYDAFAVLVGGSMEFSGSLASAVLIGGDFAFDLLSGGSLQLLMCWSLDPLHTICWSVGPLLTICWLVDPYSFWPAVWWISTAFASAMMLGGFLQLLNCCLVYIYSLCFCDDARWILCF